MEKGEDEKWNEWNERRFKKMKELADSIVSSDELEKLIATIKYTLTQIEWDSKLMNSFLTYAKAKYETLYAEELELEKEDEKMMDEIDAWWADEEKEKGGEVKKDGRT